MRRSGTEGIGVPSAGSIITPSSTAEFSFKVNGVVQRILFNDVATAEKLSLCQVRTLAPHTTGAGDFVLWVPAAEAEAAVIADGASSITGFVLAPTAYVAGAPIGTYNFITIDGSDFRILGVQEGANGTLTLDVERED